MRSSHRAAGLAVGGCLAAIALAAATPAFSESAPAAAPVATSETPASHSTAASATSTASSTATAKAEATPNSSTATTTGSTPSVLKQFWGAVKDWFNDIVGRFPIAPDAKAQTSGSSTEDAGESVVKKASGFTRAQEPPMNGSFTTSVAIDLPDFRGLQPKLRLFYDSNFGLRPTGATGGILGIGWRLEGVSEILRTSRVRGTPAFDAPVLTSTETFRLDTDDELMRCETGATSPSCTIGGTHFTRVESYRRYTFDDTSNTWTITARDGTRYVYKSVGDLAGGATGDTDLADNARWLLSEIIDTSAAQNTVQFTYACATLPVCVIDKISYNRTEVIFHTEDRPDPQSYATGKSIVVATKRLRTIAITTGGAPVRAYAMAYDATPSVTISRLVSVTPYGTDYTLDGNGVVTAGTSLPPTQVAYANGSGEASMGATPDVTGNANDKASEDQGQVIRPITGDFDGDGKIDVASTETDCRIRYQDGDPVGRICDDAILTVRFGDGYVQSYGTTIARDFGFAYGYNSRDAKTLNSIFQPRVVDLDGDGKDELVRVVPKIARPSDEEGHGGQVYDPSIKFLEITRTGATLKGTTANELTDDESHGCQLFGDFDGNGTQELLTHNTITSWTGTAWSHRSVNLPISIQIAYYYFGCPRYRIGDVNGDGKSDVVKLISPYQGDYDRVGVQIYLSDGAQFSAQPVIELQGDFQSFTSGLASCSGDTSGSSQTGKNRFALVDLNEDSKSDLAVMNDCSLGTRTYTRIMAFLSTGQTFETTGPSVDVTHDAPRYVNSGYHNRNLIIADVDGDRSPDLMLAMSSEMTRSSRSNAKLYRIQLDQTGPSLALSAAQWSGTASTNEEVPAALADFNGDGKADVLTWKYYGGFQPEEPGETRLRSYAIFLSSGPLPHLLTSSTNRFGGTTTVAYTASSAWVNNKMPFVLPTVTQVTQSPGVGDDSTVHFAYSGGFYDSVERRFLGFRSARAILPCNPGDTMCPEKIYTFRQDVASAGALESLEVWSGPRPEDAGGGPVGTLLRKDEHRWVVNTDPAQLPFTARNTSSQRTIYDGVPRATRVDRTFDAYNNVLVETELGNISVSTDDRSTTRTFAANTTAYIVDRVLTEERRNASGTLMSRTSRWYDGNSNGTVTNGHLTHEWATLDTTDIRRALHTYDTYGNRTSTTDAADCKTEWTYDPTDNLFRIETRNGAYFGCRGQSADTRHLTTATYNPVCQAMATSTDMDGLVTTSTYDVHCRTFAVTEPGGRVTTTYYLNEGIPATQEVQTVTTAPTGATARFTSSALDGYGRER
ncbi:MAG: toxin TcdB middle/N-terminal domain-containing protein, partial [Pseudomonadota bacterium]